MTFVETTVRLTDDGLSAMLMAAIGAAKAMGQPQCIVVVDQSGVTLASFRMTGSRYLSLRSAAAKARTAGLRSAVTRAAGRCPPRLCRSHSMASSPDVWSR